MEVKKFGVPDFRSPEQKAIDEAAAPIFAAANERMSEVLDTAFVEVSYAVDVQDATERWLWFGAMGERDELHFTISPHGQVTLPANVVEQLLKRAGYKPHDPDPVEVAATRRRDWARSRLQDGLNAALNRRAR